jgi:hypothetical protein
LDGSVGHGFVVNLAIDETLFPFASASELRRIEEAADE